MAHWPRTATGKSFYIGLIAVVVPLTVWFLVTVPWYVLGVLAVVALVSLGLYAWRRRLDAARERAWVGEFSFGDVVGRMRAREAVDRVRVSRERELADAR
jgi:membrane protein implicated in regulation of membrane protease activity